MEFELGDNFLYKGKYSFTLTGIRYSGGDTSYIFMKNFFPVSAMVDFADNSYISKLLRERIIKDELVLAYSEVFELFDYLVCSGIQTYLGGLYVSKQKDHCRERRFLIEKNDHELYSKNII